MQGMFKTDISRAKGLGTAHNGAHHWLHQRFTAVLNLLLLFWMVFILYCISKHEFSEIIEIVKKPYNVLAISLFALSIFYHATLGMQIIIEDYSHCRAMRLILLYTIRIVSLITSSAVVVAMFYLMTL